MLTKEEAESKLLGYGNLHYPFIDRTLIIKYGTNPVEKVNEVHVNKYILCEIVPSAYRYNWEDVQRYRGIPMTLDEKLAEDEYWADITFWDEKQYSGILNRSTLATVFERM